MNDKNFFFKSFYYVSKFFLTFFTFYTSDYMDRKQFGMIHLFYCLDYTVLPRQIFGIVVIEINQIFVGKIAFVADELKKYD